MTKDNILAAECSKFVQENLKAIQWIDNNPDVVRGEAEIMHSELRKSSRFLNRCTMAAKRKMCVSLFGPSQAGKSYLISALARDSSNNLWADFNGDYKNFITDINPEGSKESTGLVTRFTLTKIEKTPEGYPVQIRLLTEMDLVKIFTNTYYADCEHKDEANLDAIAQVLDSLESIANSSQASMQSYIILDDMEELQEYVNKNFSAKPRVQALTKSYWHRAMTLAPKLAVEYRVQLYALIWNETKHFSDLLLKLLRSLEELQHPDLAYCQLKALIPREQSIIDVAMLHGLNNDEAQNNTLELISKSGAKATLPRAIVTALTAELTIVIKEKPAEFFEHTDLLDFPGYRSRYKIDDLEKELAKENMLEELFLRGKVAYLFQRYCIERELTSMLLCVGPSNQDVQDLPIVINDWITSTHGDSPAARTSKDIALYLILTKFDLDFEKKSGAPDVKSRWDNRLQASFLKFFGMQYEWPKKWDEQGEFKNLFLLRNPGFRFDAILDYTSDNQEKGIRKDQQTFVDELEESFMQSPTVKAHFKNPREAWDAAMRLNDGGITYIREKLAPLCNPDSKRKQLESDIKAHLEKICTRLNLFYKSDDKEVERQQKEQLCRSLSKILANIAHKQKFGEFLSKLTIKDNDLYDLYFEARTRSLMDQSENNQSEVLVGTRISQDEILEDIFGEDFAADLDEQDNENPMAQPDTKARHQHKDESAHFASLIEKYWFSHLHNIADNLTIQNYYDFPAKQFSAFTQELITSFARLKLKEQIENVIRHEAEYVNVGLERTIWKQASLAATIINSFIDWLGFNPQFANGQERTIAVFGKSVTIFMPPTPIDTYPHLSEKQEEFDKQWFTDWIRTYVYSIMANVDFDGNMLVNSQENAILGNIIKNLTLTK